ncbi:type II secretion system F family protein [Qipengyuania sp. 1NDH17]|uniref:Type II secretion system F family protein n=1 Tax=Qipengyuania polymorpha TaxID=2867234 RepID=A0ABS7J3S1_9SPHN|nr:type II secretion system F family protein [Qipengyuania polymorpha]MBX7458995.1 type II secretion system F family protein [Qipengyuania polymorpha]
MLELAISNWVVRLLVLGLIFALAVGIVFFVSSWAARKRLSQSQLAKLGRDGSSGYSGSVLEEERESRWAQIAKSIESSGIKLTDINDDKLVKRLKAAGYRKASAPRVYTLVRVVMVFALPVFYLLVASASAEPPGPLQLYLFSALAAIFGFILPAVFVRAKADRRQNDIINGFPDALDLLLVCVEAGLGLEAAMERVGRELATTHPLVAELFSETTLMMRAGASREEAMRRMGETSAVDEIRSFATLMIQSDKLGTSIASTLRVYAAEMREARRMRAEEKAYRLPVLISIPLVACMLPTMIGVLVLPAAVRTIRDVLPALGGG